jgi:hypothetical protein
MMMSALGNKETLPAVDAMSGSLRKADIGSHLYQGTL